MRLLLVAGLAGLIAAFLSAGCVSELDPGRPDAATARATARARLVISTASRDLGADLADAAPPAALDAGPAPPRPDLAPAPRPDLAPGDLAGLADCYGAAYCDRSSMFCLRYFDGTPGRPGPLKVPPACFSPVDACASGTLDCACIQADGNLGPTCKECFDNQDGTFTCYEQ